VLTIDPAVLSGKTALVPTSVVELGVHQPEVTRNHEYYSKPQVNLHKKRSDDGTRNSQATSVAPRIPAVVPGEASAWRSRVRHIILFQSYGRRLWVFGRDRWPRPPG
jgi:hypothetical protein